MARCPAHQDRTPSLSVRDGERAALLVYCFAGCTQDAVIAALRERGLWPGSQINHKNVQSAPRHARIEPVSANRAHALEIWRASTPAAGTLVERYLEARGITLPVPPSLRFSPDLRHGPTGMRFPAIVAAVTEDENDGAVAVHRTYLAADGSRKAMVPSPKMGLGSLGNGAVQLAPAAPTLALTEGIEDALTVIQLFAQPAWAVLGTRYDRVALPDVVRHVVIYADAGTPGLVAAHKAVEAFTYQRRKVTLEPPPKGCSDWNEVLQQMVAA